jgi:DNA-3-methyladenine glycosylase
VNDRHSHSIGRALEPAFFDRAAPEVARDLLGMALMRRRDTLVLSYRITETEAYEGLDDLASHACRGPTKRNAVMFGPSGVLYPYLVYGIHWMLNVVTGAPGHPGAVLIRGLEGISGPGNVAKALGVDGSFYGKPASAETCLWFAETGENPSADRISCTARVGVDYAGPVWAAKEYRFVLDAKLARKSRAQRSGR